MRNALYHISSKRSAKNYGIEAKKPLFLQKLWANGNIEGKNVLDKVEGFAKMHGCDVVYSILSDSSCFPKKWFQSHGYMVNDNNNIIFKKMQ
jgi:hypothetical protein